MPERTIAKKQSIRKLGTNQYRVDTYIKVNGKRQRVRKQFKTLNDAKNFQADARKTNLITTNRKVLGLSTRTIQDMADYYFGLPRFKMIKPRSKTRNAELVGHLIEWCPENGIRYIHEFSKDTANEYINYILDTWRGKGQAHNFQIAKMLFNEELERDNPCIFRNPFPKKMPFKIKKYPPVAMSEELVNQIREHMDENEKLIFDILYYTGCRWGELQFAIWDQYTGATIRYEEHMIFDEILQEEVLWTTKTENDRTLPLHSRPKECFERLRDLPPASNNFILPDIYRSAPNTLRLQFDEVKKRTVKTYPELKNILFSKDKHKQITPKTFRSTFITHLVMKTGNVYLAKEAAGHKTIETTINHYVDSTLIHIKGGIDKLDLDALIKTKQDISMYDALTQI